MNTSGEAALFEEGDGAYGVKTIRPQNSLERSRNVRLRSFEPHDHGRTIVDCRDRVGSKANRSRLTKKPSRQLNGLVMA